MMFDYKKGALYLSVVGLLTPKITQLITAIPKVNVTLSTVASEIQVNARENIGTVVSQGVDVGKYVAGLVGNPGAGTAWIAYAYTVVGMIVLGFAGMLIADYFSLDKSKWQRAVVPLVIATLFGGLVVLPWIAGTLTFAMFSAASISLALSLSAGAAVAGTIIYFVDEITGLKIVP